MKTIKDLQVGVKYPGYGFVNEYGEFQFTPSEIGSRKEQRTLVVKEGDDYSVYKTKQFVIFHMKIKRSLNLMERIKALVSVMDNFIKVMKEYEI